MSFASDLLQTWAMFRVPSTFIFQAYSFLVSHLSTFVSEAVWITTSGLSLRKRFKVSFMFVMSNCKEFGCNGLVL